MAVVIDVENNPEDKELLEKVNKMLKYDKRIGEDLMEEQKIDPEDHRLSNGLCLLNGDAMS